MTIHKAKGLEFNTVFIPRLNEREFPTLGFLGKDIIMYSVVYSRKTKQNIKVVWKMNENYFMLQLPELNKTYI